MSILSQFVKTKSALLFVALGVACVGSANAVSTLNDDFQAVVESGGNLVAINFQSDFFTSDDDGITFTPRAKPLGPTPSDAFEGLGALGATVIAVGNDGLILRAPDSGQTWSLATSPVLSGGSLYAVAGRPDGANPNRWIAVGDDGFDGYVYRSNDDGLIWTNVAMLSGLSLEDIIWTGSRWLATGRENDFNKGVVYSSTDGAAWSPSSVPVGVSPLLALAADGGGVVLAVGEAGQILRSTDDGLSFVAIANQFLGGGDLNAVIVDGSGTFFVGGDEKRIIEINGTTATTLVPAAANAAPVLGFFLIDGEPVAIGGFFSSFTRTIPFAIQFSVGGSLDYVLSVAQTLTGKTYYVETTTDLTANDWSIVPNTSVSGTNGPISFEVAEDELRRFWRIVEF